MCLRSVTKTFEKPSSAVTIAYKVFDVSESGKTLYAPYQGGKMQQGKWLTAEINHVTADDGKSYDTGFHCYTNRRKALSHSSGKRVIAVKVRNITCKGTQWCWNTAMAIVATQMFIPRQRKRKRA